MALDAETLQCLAKIRKGGTARFVLVNKGVRILNLVVYRRGSFDTRLKQAKSNGNGNVFAGVVDGSASLLVFKLPTPEYSAPPGRELILKDFLASEGEIRTKVEYELVPTTLEELYQSAPIEEEASESGVGSLSSDGVGDGPVDGGGEPEASGRPRPEAASRLDELEVRSSPSSDGLQSARARVDDWLRKLTLPSLPAPQADRLRLVLLPHLKLVKGWLEGRTPVGAGEVNAAIAKVNQIVAAAKGALENNRGPVDSSPPDEAPWIVDLRRRWQDGQSQWTAAQTDLLMRLAQRVPNERPSEIGKELDQFVERFLTPLRSALAPFLQTSNPSADEIGRLRVQLDADLRRVKSEPLFEHLELSQRLLGVRRPMSNELETTLKELAELLPGV